MKLNLTNRKNRSIVNGSVIRYLYQGKERNSMVVGENPDARPRLVNLESYSLDRFDFKKKDDIFQHPDIVVLEVIHPSDLSLNRIN